MDFPLAVFSKKTWSFAPNTSLPDILDDLFSSREAASPPVRLGVGM
jgi:hypothetical protein